MDTITIEDFAKATSGLKVGTIKEVRPHPNAEKLICLQVDVGDGDVRPVVAGIKKHYTAEELVGKQIIVCTNLPPANLRGEESKGMLLAASDADGLSLVTLDKPRVPGSPIK